MELSASEKKLIKDYEKELKEKKQLSSKEIENLIKEKNLHPYESMRKLMENFLPRAYEISKEYKNSQLSALDFLHAANEGLEVAITTKEYFDEKSLMEAIDETIKESIELLLSYTENNDGK